MSPRAKRPLVTVVLTTYNRPDYLREAIDSVLAQTFTDFELLIVDDGSDVPDPRDIAQEYAKQDARIRALALPDNVGLSAARNKGIEEARGKYIAFHDDDDLVASEGLAAEVAFLEANPDFGAVRGAVRRFGENFQTRDVGPDEPFSIQAGTVIDTEEQLRMLNLALAGPHLSLLRKDVLTDIGGFREWFLKSEVWDLSLRILDKYSLAVLPDLCSHYRTHHLERLTGSTDIYRYYGAAFLCARYRHTGRKDPVGEGVHPQTLAPLFAELPECVKLDIVNYALGNSMPTAVSLEHFDLVDEIYRDLLSFASEKQRERVENITAYRARPALTKSRLRQLMQQGKFAEVRDMVLIWERLAINQNSLEKKHLMRRNALKYSLKYFKPGYWFA